MTTREWLTAHRSQFKVRAELINACIKATGKDPSNIRKVTAKLLGPGGTGGCRPIPIPAEGAPVQPRAKASRKTLNDFQKTFDKSFIIPQRIKDGIAKYLKGGFWETDLNFRELCKVPPHLWRQYAEAFDAYQIRVDGKVVWAEPDTIEKMREMTL